MNVYLHLITGVAKYLNLGEDLHVNKNKKSLIRSIRKSIEGINDGEDTTGEPGDDVAAADLGREELLSNILNMVETMHLEEQQANILAKNVDLNKTEKKNSSSPEEGIAKPSETGMFSRLIRDLSAESASTSRKYFKIRGCIGEPHRKD